MSLSPVIGQEVPEAANGVSPPDSPDLCSANGPLGPAPGSGSGSIPSWQPLKCGGRVPCPGQDSVGEPGICLEGETACQGEPHTDTSALNSHADTQTLTTSPHTNTPPSAACTADTEPSAPPTDTPHPAVHQSDESLDEALSESPTGCESRSAEATPAGSCCSGQEGRRTWEGEKEKQDEEGDEKKEREEEHGGENPAAEEEEHGGENPAAEEEEHGGENPAAEEEEHGGENPAVEEEEHGENPAVEEEEHGEENPAAEEEEHKGENPATEEEEHGGENPAAEEEEHGGENPAAEEEEHGGENPAAEEEEHGGENPAAEEEEHGGENPAAEEEEHEGENPAAEEEEHEGENPAAEEAEHGGENPAVEEKEKEEPVPSLVSSPPLAPAAPPAEADSSSCPPHVMAQVRVRNVPERERLTRGMQDSKSLDEISQACGGAAGGARGGGRGGQPEGRRATISSALELEGTVSHDGDLTHFITRNLEQKIKMSSKPSLDCDCESERDSDCSGPIYRGRGSLRRPADIPPIDPAVLLDLERHTQEVAHSVEMMMRSLNGTIQNMTALSVGYIQTYRDSVDSLGESVDMSIKGMYTLMARCEELDRSMQPIHSLAAQIRDVKRTLDALEAICK